MQFLYTKSMKDALTIKFNPTLKKLSLNINLDFEKIIVCYTF